MSSVQPAITADRLRPYDILCGKSKTAFHNVGNRRFRVTISMNLPAYSNCTTKMERSMLVDSIVRNLIERIGARFLKPLKKSDGFIEMSKRQAHEKVAHALRDMAVSQKRMTMGEWTKQKEFQQKQERRSRPKVSSVVLENEVPDLSTTGHLDPQMERMFELQRSMLKSLLEESSESSAVTAVKPAPVLSRLVSDECEPILDDNGRLMDIGNSLNFLLECH